MAKQKSSGDGHPLFRGYLTTTISIALILFLCGLLGILLINAQRLSNFVKENIGITLILKEETSKSEMLTLEKNLGLVDFIRSAKYVDKDTAAIELRRELGEDFVAFLGKNPLLSSIDVKLKAEYANPDSLAVLEKKFLAYPQIQEVYYQKILVKQLNENVRKISAILLSLTALMFIIFIALINNTIRMSIYSKRFLINTMLLVGATRAFIRRPFMIKGFLHAVYGGLVACFLLLMIFLSYQSELKLFVDFEHPAVLFELVIGLFLLGIFICLISTYFAVNKFLRMNFDQLFY